MISLVTEFCRKENDHSSCCTLMNFFHCILIDIIVSSTRNQEWVAIGGASDLFLVGHEFEPCQRLPFVSLSKKVTLIA